ncbi:hypothetical protein KKC17_02165 [Patescibacteria group bacterium]|nr:hypothetical protein [Patescibacteria group bacterium]
MLNKNKFIELFNSGLTYRYPFVDWQLLSHRSGAKYPSLFKEVHVKGRKYVDELIQPLLCPIKLKMKEVEQLEGLAKLWPKIITRQLDLAQAGWLTDNSLEIYGLDGILSGEEEDCLLDAGYNQPLSPFIRLDLIRTTQGFKVVDINSTRPAGVGDNIILSEAYGRSGDHHQFCLKEEFVSTFKAAYLSWSNQNNYQRSAKIAILLDSVAGDWHNFVNLKKVLLDQSWVEGVDIFTGWFDFIGLGYNCLLRGRIKQGHSWYNDLLQLPRHKICLISPLGRRFIGNKKWFFAWQHFLLGSLFKEDLGFDYQLLVDSCCEVGLLRSGGLIMFTQETKHFSQLIRQEWILKSPAGSSGRGIIIGEFVSQKNWNSIFSQPEMIGSVVQKYEPVKEKVVLADKAGKPSEAELFTKYGAFLFNGRLAGLEVMARGTPLVHGARNTYLSTVIFD